MLRGEIAARAAVYITLRRLDMMGLLESWMSEPGNERGAKPRRCVRITPAGLRVGLLITQRVMRLQYLPDPDARRSRDS